SFHGTHYDELVTRWRRGFSWNPWSSLKNTVAIIMVVWKILMWDFRTIFHADGIIATSNEQSDLLKSFYRLPSDRIFGIWNGMDLSAFSPGEPSPDLLKKLDIRETTPTILCMARLIRDKGIQHMIAAMPAILRAVPNCKLIIVGDGNYRISLERLSTSKGLTSHIVFTGMADFMQLPEYFRLCSVFVNPTVQQNGYDLTMVEAMACEKVVISSNIGSTPTLIEDSVDGILFPTAHVHILADRVIQVLQDPHRRNEIGKRARHKVLNNFTLDQMVERTMTVYRTLLENS
ncbi:MAG TPA: glycosyltransferase family 4 protein, partial [Bacteroidota bacterium]|nr:glycosyltransferase family 4 protein [Bacteroidota bacterium]